MSYGFEIRDNEGTLVVSNSRVMHIKSTTSMVFPTELSPNDGQFMMYGDTRMTDFINSSVFGHLEPNFLRSFPGTWTAINVPGGRTAIPPDVAGQEDLIFVQLGESRYLTAMSHLHFDFPDLPQRIAPIARGTITSARIMSPTPPPTPGAGAYGMQLFNAGGTCVFDSRLVTFGIPAAYVVSAATIESILFNNITHDLTLPFAIPNCWISVPFFEPLRIVYRAAGFFGGYMDTFRVKIEQVNDTTLRLSRVLSRAKDIGSFPPEPQGFYTQTLVLFVMRNS